MTMTGTDDKRTICPGCWDEDCHDCNDPSTPPAGWNSAPSSIHGRLTNRASDKQVSYLVRLGMSYDEASELSRSQASDAIDRLRSQPKANPASDKQTSYLKSLLDSQDVDDDLAAGIEVALGKGLDKQSCSKLIDELRAMPRKPKTEDNPKGELEDGIYERNGEIYKVYKTQRGFKVAKILEVLGKHNAKFVYVGKAPLRDLTSEHKLTLAQAKEFGAVYGVCCVCSATLTDEDSIAAGIGPVCATKF